MKLHLVCFVYVILGINGMNSSEETSDAALSSCLNMLQYQRDGNEWFGLVQVQSPNATKTLKLELLLSLPGRLPSQYAGSVELYGTKEEAARNVTSNQLVQYRVRFPLQDVLPKLDQISVNGQVRCTEPPDSAPLVTQIRLEFTLFLEPSHLQLGHAEPQQLNITGLHYMDAPQRPVKYGTYKSDCSLTAEEICGTRKYDSELSLGNETSASQKWPWLVPIYVYKAYGPVFQCGGTLISARIVVTAASCFLTTNGTLTANDVLIGLGRHNILNWQEGQLATVKELVIHSDFMLIEGSKDADIAIAVLQDKVHFTENIRPICLWKGDQSLEGVVGQWGTVAGWGGDGVNMLLTPEPKSIKMPIVSAVDCLRSSEAYSYITSQRTFCAGSRDGLGPCKRDEGGGMMLKVNNKWMLRGIVSFVLSDWNYACNVNEYVVFTDVAKFGSWIVSFL